VSACALSLGSSLHDYVANFQNLLSQLELRFYFQQGLKTDTANHVRENHPATLDETIQIAMRFDQAGKRELRLDNEACLSRKPVLIYPDYQLPFKLTTDASKAGLGAVLSQDQVNGDQPVAYASKVNSPTVAKYNISELECLAVVWAVRLFRPHLYGRKFVIVTNHVAFVT
jgi:hypothetical protein